MNQLLPAVIRRLHWHRRPIAMALAVIAVLATVAAAQEGRSGATTPVLVATRGVAAGQEVTAADVTVRQVVRDVVPREAFARVEDVVGKVATSGFGADTVLTSYSVVTPKLARDSGRVLAPLRIADADIAHYLTVGDVIDVWSATDVQARTVARRARIVAIPETRDAGFGGSDSRGVLLVIDVTAADAQALAQASAAGRLTVALT